MEEVGTVNIGASTRRKDEGYSWVVLGAAFLISIVGIGLPTFGTIGIIVVAWNEKFELTASTTSLGGSINSGLFMLAAPAGTMLIHKIGCWKTAMIGSLFLLTGSVGGAFISEFWQGLVCYGVLQGFGASMLYMVCNEMADRFFHKHVDKIYSMILIGFYLGMVMGPCTTEYLLRVFDYKYTQLILAALYALTLPFSLIFARTPPNDIPAEKTLKATISEIKLDNLEKVEEKFGMDNPVMDETDDKNAELAETPEQQKTKKTWRIILTNHLFVLREPTFLLIMASAFLFTIAETIFYTLMMDYVIHVAYISKADAALGVTFSGVAAVVGAIIMTIASTWRVNRLLVFMASTFITMVAALLLPVLKGKIAYFFLAMLFGLGDSLYVSNLPSFARSYGDNDHTLIRLSYILLSCGIGAGSGPTIGALLYKVDPDGGGIYMAGAVLVLAFLIMVPYTIRSFGGKFNCCCRWKSTTYITQKM